MKIYLKFKDFHFKKLRSKISSGKCRAFCLGFNVLNNRKIYINHDKHKLSVIFTKLIRGYHMSYRSQIGNDWTRRSNKTAPLTAHRSKNGQSITRPMVLKSYKYASSSLGNIYIYIKMLRSCALVIFIYTHIYIYIYISGRYFAHFWPMLFWLSKS